MQNKIKDIIYNIFFREKVVIGENEDLKGQVVVITGASKGVGLSIAQVLAKQGATLALLSRNADILYKNRQLKNHLLLNTDVSDYKQSQRTVRKILEKFGKIDVLINNAGIYYSKNIEDFRELDIQNMIKTNINGVINITSLTVPYMKIRRKGLIIQIGSKISHNSTIEEGRSVYAATKFAIEGFSNALNNELNKYGIRVSCLMPGTVKTFRTTQPQKYISPYILADLVSMLIRNKNINYESILINSIKQ